MTAHELHQLDLLLNKMEHELDNAGAPLSIRRFRSGVRKAITFLGSAQNVGVVREQVIPVRPKDVLPDLSKLGVPHRG